MRAIHASPVHTAMHLNEIAKSHAQTVKIDAVQVLPHEAHRDPRIIVG